MGIGSGEATFGTRSPLTRCLLRRKEIQFVTMGASVPLGVGHSGRKAYYDVKHGRSPELDAVALYQNPCRCWSVGLYYLKFPDREQYSFMLSLTGVGWTESAGTVVMRTLTESASVG